MFPFIKRLFNNGSDPDKLYLQDNERLVTSRYGDTFIARFAKDNDGVPYVQYYYNWGFPESRHLASQWQLGDFTYEEELDIVNQARDYYNYPRLPDALGERVING